MASICITSIRRSGGDCDHRIVTVDLDGQPFEVHTSETELDAMSWDDRDKLNFILLGLKYQRTRGLDLDKAPRRVVNGEESTNVKQYLLLTRDVTKNNIGTVYVNVPPGAQGERSLVEFTGCTEGRIILNMNMVGIGPVNFRIVRDVDNAILYESPNVATAGEKELDTDWFSLPPAADGLYQMRLQAKSATPADDPVFRRCVMVVR